MDDLVWLDDLRFQVDGITFQSSNVERFRSSSSHFLLVKHPRIVARYQELLRSLEPDRIVELGICEGGSTALLWLLARPERLVAVDLRDDPAGGLEELIEARTLHAQVRTQYGFDQADEPRLRALLDDEFGDAPLDLVIDDASHRVNPTRTSFNVLFPRLRPGGVYVIEDWSGQHYYERVLNERAKTDEALRRRLEAHVASGEPGEAPLSVLLFELTLAAGFAPDLFSEIVIGDGWAHVVRGEGDIPAESFDLSQVYTPRAGRLIARHG